MYLIAYCHLRKDVRLFAIERIRSISLTDHPYQMPLGFNVDEYVQDALMVMRGRRIDVELLFAKTAAAWVKPASAGEASNGQIFWKGANNYLRVGNLAGTRLDVGAGVDLATTDAVATTTSAIPTGSFSHVAMTFATSTMQTQIYINGALKTTGSAGSGNTATESNNLLIGGTTTNNFDGQIDDFQLFNYTLTAVQVKTLYTGGAVRFGP